MDDDADSYAGISHDAALSSLCSYESSSPPPIPWERAGATSSGPPPFQPPTPGRTSDVVEASVVFSMGILNFTYGGALVDYYGGKVVMAWGVAIWSLATFFTPWAAETSMWALLAMRVLLCTAEGVALPSMNNMISREFGPFVTFGLTGLLWVLVWVSATSSTPNRHSQISKYELDYITNMRQSPAIPGLEKKLKMTSVIPPFGGLLSKLPTWALISVKAMHSWGYFVILSWMPIYFSTIHHVDLRQAAWFSAVPWTMIPNVIYGYV